MSTYSKLPHDTAQFKEGSYLLQEDLAQGERKFGPVNPRKPKPPESVGNGRSTSYFQHPLLGDKAQFGGNPPEGNPVAEQNEDAQLTLAEVQEASLQNNPQLQNRLTPAQKYAFQQELAKKYASTPKFHPQAVPRGG